MKYSQFIQNKQSKIMNIGFQPTGLPDGLFDFQSSITEWAIKKGKSAVWGGCGTGKTMIQTAYADAVVRHTGQPVLILAPLAVSAQTKEEAKKINIDVSDSGIIRITNYEQLDGIDPSIFAGVVLDESSILKNFSGKLRNKIIESFHRTPYKLCCSATPSPNDFAEIGNHAEFLNICSRTEMLSTFFIHDSGATQKWRLKGHAETEFFKWLSTWAVMFEKPSNLGFSDDGFILPPLNQIQHIVKSNTDGFLFPELAKTLTERRKARKESITERCELAARLSLGSNEPWLYWCDLNDESKTLSNMMDDCVEVSGSQKNEIKKDRMLGFSTGKYQKLVTKPKIAQFGMNWQHCNNMVFVGLSDSFESMYQAVRRCYRFGQKKKVNVHIVISEKEGNVLDNINRKEANAKKMLNRMISCMSALSKAEINNTTKQSIEYKPIKSMEVPGWLSTRPMAKVG